MMCPFRVLMLFLCSIASVVGAYFLISSDTSLSLSLKEKLLGTSHRVQVALQVTKVFGMCFLLMLHLDVFLQLGYAKAFIHSALGIYATS